ncbi:hypothetical protein Ocin01_17888 [Orchesella cincta]|uniref:Uncharacterized protein n=1 Tax=Orchesella cincta TaxID=48709 RepID=A0A1D2M745_ORCCI|nr:hypothetical protein Ocin01_17888 [Orchesella cincta]
MPPFVSIRVTGPKTLVPKPVSSGQDCDVNCTWIQFLTAKCHLRLTLKDNVIVRKASHGRGTNAEANLGDHVADFISTNYSRQRPSYTIRLTLVTPRTRLSSGFRPQPEMVTAESGSRKSVSVKNHERKRKVTFRTGRCDKLCIGCVPSRINARTSSRFQPPMELEPLRNSSFGVDVEDVRSVTAFVEERELERAGVQNHFIKNAVICRLNSFNNTELVRIHHELQTLVDDHAWCRLTYRVPRAAHLLSNAFQLETIPRL